MAKFVFEPFKRPRHYRHYAVGMKANDSTIVRIAYPKDTVQKLREQVSRN